MDNWSFNKNLAQRKENLETYGYNAYCLFTLTGKEVVLAKELNKDFDDILALPVLKMAHRSRMGEKSEVQVPLLDSYIFLFLPKDRDIREIRIERFSFRVLDNKNDGGRLVGGDLDYANFVKENNGLVSLSQAIKVNGIVRIVNGPLKKMEGKIIKYDKHNRNCLIEIEFLGKTIATWLPFEYIDSTI